jgi:membrane peptidoglycan carboxypeptidase
MNYKMGFSDTKAGGSKRSPHANTNSNSGLHVSSSSLIKPGNTGNYRNIKKFNPFEGLNLGIFKRKNLKPGTSPSKLSDSKDKKSRKAVIRKVLSIASGVFFFMILVIVIVAGIYLKDIEQKLPKPGELIDRSSDQTTIIYDRNGKELYKIYAQNGQNRTWVNLSDVNEYTIKALLASEDTNFYQHKGIDWLGIVRCGWLSTLSYASGSGNTCGASTISQQLVRNTLMYDAFGAEAYERGDLYKTFRRKVREILMTIQVEQTLTKDQILERYINEVGMGGANNGFEAGAQSIFGKSVKDLTLAESAVLVGILPSPERYNPVFGSEPNMAAERQTYVLDMLEKHKDILGVPSEDIEKARTEELVYKSASIDIDAPHFVFYVKNLLVEKYGQDIVERGGLRVTTTLDLDIQNIAQEEIVNGVNNLGLAYNVNNGAAVGIDPKTGQIIMMVGSVDYNNTTDRRVDGNVNDTLAPRQMGSSMKPYTYLTAFEMGYGPWLNTPDIKDFNFNYNAVNWDFEYQGFMTARQALVQSRNIPALYTLQLVGIENFIQTTERLGITSQTGKEDYGLSLTLGSADMTLLEHTAAYSVFSNEGIKKDIVAILKVEDKNGNVLEEYKDNGGTRVFDEKVIYLLNYTLCDLGGYYDQLMNYQYLQGGQRFACGKGGTNLKVDAPTDIVQMLYHKNFTLGVWLGNNDNSEFVPGAYSSTIPLPISIAIMQRIQSKYPSELFNRPAGVSSVAVCKSTGMAPVDGVGCDQFGQEGSVYIVGQAPQTEKRKKEIVCKANLKKPTDLTIAKKFDLLREVSVLTDYTLANKDQDPYFKKLLTENVSLGLMVKEPEVGDCPLPLGPGDTPIIEITSPVANATYLNGDTVNVTVAYRVKNNVTKVKYYLDGVAIPGGTITTAPYNFSFALSTSVDTHTITAEITDSDNKVSESNQDIIVTEPIVVTPVISVTSPTSGQVLTAPFTASATVTTGTVSSLQFVVSKVGGGTTFSVSASLVGGVWSATINPGVQAGDYTIKAVGDSVESGSVTFNYAP